MNLINCIILLILTTTTIGQAPTIDVVFIIQSPDSEHQNAFSKRLKKDIIKQTKDLQPKFRIKVKQVNEIFNYPGGWTIHNLIPKLMSQRRKQQVDATAHKHMKKDENIDDNKDIEIINENTRWVVFCEAETKVKLKLLMESLNNENHMQPLFLGHALYDREPTIIHHFAFFENPKWFPYPMLRAGVVLSLPLVKSIADIYNNQKVKLFKQQFSIDAGHELARFIHDNLYVPLRTPLQNKNQNINCLNNTLTTTNSRYEKTKNLPTSADFDAAVINNVESSSTDFCTMTTNKNKDIHVTKTFKPTSDRNTSIIKKQKIILKKASYICPAATWENGTSKNNVSCAMYAEQTFNPLSTTNCTPVKREEIYFAVKTCSKYHHERLPIIQATWAPYAKHVKYFSDIKDNLIPTAYSGVQNVEVGHCLKTLNILRLALEDIENYNRKQQHFHQTNQKQQEEYNNKIKWLFLCDDDTLLSVSGVCQVLGCYHSMDEIYLGERYGYRLFAEDGFNYITGGGGIALSLSAVKLILQHCSCPSATAPDDMILGSCLHNLHIEAVHSSRFHQARPNDYPWELLQLEPPVSFHKFWQLDPLDVYKQWFAASDQKLFGNKYLNLENHKNDDHHYKLHKLLTKSDPLNLDEITVPLMASTVHHSKDRHHVEL